MTDPHSTVISGGKMFQLRKFQKALGSSACSSQHTLTSLNLPRSPGGGSPHFSCLPCPAPSPCLLTFVLSLLRGPSFALSSLPIFSSYFSPLSPRLFSLHLFPLHLPRQTRYPQEPPGFLLPVRGLSYSSDRHVTRLDILQTQSSHRAHKSRSCKPVVGDFHSTHSSEGPPPQSQKQAALPFSRQQMKLLKLRGIRSY